MHREIAERTPFVLTPVQAQIMYNDFREELEEKIEQWTEANAVPVAPSAPRAPKVPAPPAPPTPPSDDLPPLV